MDGVEAGSPILNVLGIGHYSTVNLFFRVSRFSQCRHLFWRNRRFSTVKMDKSDASNWVLVVTKDNKELARLPLNKDVIMIGTTTYEMEGRTIFAPKTGKTYVPQQAVELVQSKNP